jgi:hypothetical protein
LAPDLTAGTDGIRLVTTVLLGAARKDPAAALSAISELPQELQSHALGSALVGWAGEHPTDALTWAAANGVDLSEAKALSFHGDYGGVGSYSLFSAALNSDRAKTLDWLRAQPRSPERDSMLRDGTFNGTFEERLQVYAELTPKGQADAAWYLVQSSFRTNESSIEPWVKAHPPGAARKAAIQALVALQVGNSPERIDALADDWPAGADRDAALRGIASSLSSNDPRRALDFARRVNAPEARESTFASIAQNWLYRDEPAARAWIIGAPEIPAEEKRVLLRQYDER